MTSYWRKGTHGSVKVHGPHPPLEAAASKTIPPNVSPLNVVSSAVVVPHRSSQRHAEPVGIVKSAGSTGGIVTGWPVVGASDTATDIVGPFSTAAYCWADSSPSPLTTQART